MHDSSTTAPGDTRISTTKTRPALSDEPRPLRPALLPFAVCLPQTGCRRSPVFCWALSDEVLVSHGGVAEDVSQLRLGLALVLGGLQLGRELLGVARVFGAIRLKKMDSGKMSQSISSQEVGL